MANGSVHDVSLDTFEPRFFTSPRPADEDMHKEDCKASVLHSETRSCLAQKLYLKQAGACGRRPG